jgi:hypothetical protein
MKLIVTIFSIVVCQTVFPQDKFTGFGRLKIGGSYSEVIAAVGLSDSKLINPNEKKVDWLDVYDNKKDYLLVYSQEKTPADLSVFYCKAPSSKVLLLSKYEVSGIIVNRIKLSFYNDTLIDIFIKSAPSEFDEAVNAKYGKGKTETETKQVTCSSIYGNSTHEENYYRTYWNKGDNIEAISYLAKYRDSKCKEVFMSYFDICDTTQKDLMESAAKAFTQEESERKLSDKKKNLSDF